MTCTVIWLCHAVLLILIQKVQLNYAEEFNGEIETKLPNNVVYNNDKRKFHKESPSLQPKILENESGAYRKAVVPPQQGSHIIAKTHYLPHLNPYTPPQTLPQKTNMQAQNPYVPVQKPFVPVQKSYVPVQKPYVPPQQSRYGTGSTHVIAVYKNNGIPPQYPPVQHGPNLRPNSILDELKMFISQIINFNKIYEINPRTLELLVRLPDLEQQINNIILSEYNPSKMHPKIILDLIHLLEMFLHKKPLTEYPIWLLELVLALDGTKDLAFYMLNWLKEHKTVQLLEILLEIIKNAGGIMPRYLKLWILSLDRGKRIIDFLVYPGNIKCKLGPNGDAVCYKTRIRDPNSVPDHTLEELKKFISGIKKHTLYNIPTNILDNIINYPDLERHINIIINDEKITSFKINSRIIIELLHLMEKFQHGQPLTEYPITLLELVLAMRGTKDLAFYMLNWLKEYKTVQLLGILREIIKDAGGTIPHYLKLWILSLDKRKRIIDFLEYSGSIQCKLGPNGDALCYKIQTPEPYQIPEHQGVPEDILKELKMFILTLNKQRLYNIPTNILDLIIKYPDLEKHINIIINDENISWSDINSKIIIELLHVMEKLQHKKLLNMFSKRLLELVFNLLDARNLAFYMLDWLRQYNAVEMMNMLLEIYEERGSKEIPRYLKLWLQSLPDGEGKRIEDYIVLPGVMTCKNKGTADVECTKTFLPSSVNQNVNVNYNEKLVEV